MKAIVLLSGGMDSTVNLYEAKLLGEVKLCLTFDYGQRAAKKEALAAQRISHLLGLPHKLISLPFFEDYGQSSLIDKSINLPLEKAVQIDDLAISQKTAKSVWVPNRNGIFLNIAAGFAEALGAEVIVPGFNREEATTFPDNSEEFMKATTNSLKLSTANHVRVLCPTVNLDKSEIVKRGQQLGVDWSLIWPCYQALENWCGQCESCLRAKRAFSSQGLRLFN